MTDLAIVDLELGNLHSVRTAFERAGVTPSLVTTPEEVRAASRLVVPGQGAIAQCSAALKKDGLGEALLEKIRGGTPYLGICLGMQALFEESEESPGAPGLGLFEGRVVRFGAGMKSPEGARLKVPHMGWNAVAASHPFMDDGAHYYFVHSYHCVPVDDSIIVGRAEYGVSVCAAVAKDNVFACQFHPEKSQHAGARLIRRFLEVV